MKYSDFIMTCDVVRDEYPRPGATIKVTQRRGMIGPMTCVSVIGWPRPVSHPVNDNEPLWRDKP